MVVIEFMGMISEKLGAIEKYNMELSKQIDLKKNKVVYVYNKMPENVDYIEKLKSYNSDVLELNPALNIFKKVKLITQIIRKYNPDVIHCHFNFPLIRLVILIAWINRVPKRLVSIRSMPGVPNLLSKIWYKGLLFLSTNFLTVSNKIRETILTNFQIKKQDKIKLIYRGIDFSLSEQNNKTKEEIKEQNNIPLDKLLVGCVAFHHPVKGVDLLLEVMNVLVNKHSRKDILLVQIGYMEGEYHNNLMSKTQEYNLEENVIWLGLRNDVPELMKMFDVYCQPSRLEGLGLSLVEAYASKCPAIAFEIGGIPEVVKDNESGFLIKPFEIEDFADKVIEILDNRELRNQLGNTGYNVVKQNFELKNQVSKMISFYEK